MQTLELQLWVQLTSAKLLKNNRKRKKRKQISIRNLMNSEMISEYLSQKKYNS